MIGRGAYGRPWVAAAIDAVDRALAPVLATPIPDATVAVANWGTLDFHAQLALTTLTLQPDASVVIGVSSAGTQLSWPALVAGGITVVPAGAAPFGAQVSGTGTFPSPIASSTAAPITRAMTAYVYFPAGRVAGGQALLTMQSQAVAGLTFFGTPVTLASDLSATGLSVSGHDETITADLLPGSGGLLATIAANFASPGTDVGDDRTGTLTMCPSGDAPAPSLQVSAAVLSPLANLSLNGAGSLLAPTVAPSS